MIDRFERVERRCDAIERRIADGAMAVSSQFAELRAYTEFGCERLDKAINGLSSGIARLNASSTGYLRSASNPVDAAPRHH